MFIIHQNEANNQKRTVFIIFLSISFILLFKSSIALSQGSDFPLNVAFLADEAKNLSSDMNKYLFIVCLERVRDGPKYKIVKSKGRDGSTWNESNFPDPFYVFTKDYFMSTDAEGFETKILVKDLINITWYRSGSTWMTKLRSRPGKDYRYLEWNFPIDFLLVPMQKIRLVVPGKGEKEIDFYIWGLNFMEIGTPRACK